MLAGRLQREYPGAAATIGRLVSTVREAYYRRDELSKRARELGEKVDLGHPESFRKGPRRRSVSYPAPVDEQNEQCSAEEAPRDVVRWEGGEPVPVHDDVRIIPRGVERAESLATSIGSLPGLKPGDPAFVVTEPPEREPSTADIAVGRAAGERFRAQGRAHESEFVATHAG